MKRVITVRMSLEVPPKGMTLPQIFDFLRGAVRGAQEALPHGSIIKTANFDDLTISLIEDRKDYSK